MKRAIQILLCIAVSLFFCSCATTKYGTHSFIRIETPHGEEISIEGMDEFPFYDRATDLPKIKGLWESERETQAKVVREGKVLDNRFGDKKVIGLVENSSKPLKVDIYSEDTVYRVVSKPLNDMGYHNIYWYNDTFMTFKERDKAIRSMRRNGLYMKGNWKFNITLPFMDHLSWRPEAISQRITDFGFWGLELGFEYFYKDNASIELSANFIMNYEIPVLVGIDYEWVGPFEDMWQSNFTLTNYHQVGLFSLGYGLNVSRDTWSYRYFEAEGDREYYAENGWDFPEATHGTENMRSNHWAIGPVFKAYVNLDPNVRMGIACRPTAYSFGAANPWQYGHSITLDFKFAVNMKKPQSVPRMKKNKP